MPLARDVRRLPPASPKVVYSRPDLNLPLDAYLNQQPAASSVDSRQCPAGSFLWPELRNGLGPPDLVEDVLLLLEGVGLGEVDLNLAQHFHSGPVVEHDIDLSRI